MNSVNRFRPAVQFRCCPSVGSSPFGYVQIVRSGAFLNNYQSQAEVVEQLRMAFDAMNEEGHAEWKRLTGNTETGEESLSTSLAMTGKSSRSFSGDRAMSMTACSQLSVSGKNLSGWTDEH